MKGRIMNDSSPDEEEIKPIDLSYTYELFIFGLTVFSTISWLFIYVFSASRDAVDILLSIDRIVSWIYVFDFLITLRRVPNRMRYLRWGWLDLLGSIPLLPQLRILRLGHLVWIARILRQTTGERVLTVYRERRGESALLTVGLGLIWLLFITSLLVVNAEQTAPNANIRTGQDAVWWAIVTMATVGYGDYYPVTSDGRLVGIVLMTGGVALIGVLTGYLASNFAPGKRETDQKFKELKDELNEIKSVLADLSRKRPPD
jgi:voltage-gated potassium channel